MDTVINRLAEIETGASRILENANQQKQVLAKEMEAKIAAFDAQMDAETEKKLASIHQDLQKEMDQALTDLQKNTEKTLADIHDHFQTECDARAEEIVKQILK